jgi:hypothetical protein
MKYLKRFNEELKPRTYMNAAKKLTDLGHTDRANTLKDWANESEKREDMIKWKERVQEYSAFGTYKVNIVNPDLINPPFGEKYTGDFYLDINFDELAFEDNFEYEKEKDPNNINGVGIFFFIGLIPTSEEVLKKCEEVMPDAEFGNGMFWGMSCGIDFKVENGQVILEKFTLEDYDENLSGNVSFADRASAGKFKNLLKSIFSNPDLNYPSGYTDADSIYQKLEQVILIQQGFSSDYGFELKNVADFINTQSPNTMYKTI